MTGPRINLNDEEKAIFEVLNTAAEKAGVVLRVAGGWVRDKLLGKECHDIDIAIDQMTGVEFATRFLNTRVSVIEANPEQSKHLETAIVRINGRQVELLNLRTEDYAGAYEGEGRVLTENRFGTPAQDAQRRDLTINAMFFNLATGRVEDFVGGLADLGIVELPYSVWERQYERIVLRTPLDPLKTFIDDPLRVMRVLRFLSKMENSRITPEVKNAMLDGALHKAFASKVSPERIAKEMLGDKEIDEEGEEAFKPGILNGKRCVEAIELMANVGLLDVILDVPLMTGFAPFDMDQRSPHHKWGVLEHTLNFMRELIDHPHVKEMPPARRSRFMFAALLHDIGKRDPNATQIKPDGTRSYVGHDMSSARVARQVCEKLKLSNEVTDYVVTMCDNHMAPHDRGWGSKSSLRRLIARMPDAWKDVIVHAECDARASGVERPASEYERYQTAIVTGDSVLNEVTVEPPLNGNIIVGMFPEMSQGPWIRDLVKHLCELRFDDPDLTEADYIAEVERKRPEVLTDPKYERFRIVS